LNRESEKREKKSSDKPKERIKEVLLLCVLAILLIIVVWQVFGKKNKNASDAVTYSEKELKMARLLEKMEGVGDAEVMIYEGDNEVESVVVLCDGAEDLRVIMSVREAVATALGTEEKKIKVYLKKE
jgi:hypothetical protein